MPNLTDPFPGMTPGKRLSTSETVRALRLDLTAEEDAIATYTAHAEATGNALVRKTLLSIADEERVHAGELQELIRRLAPEEEKHLQAGSREVAGEAKGAKKMGKVLRKEVVEEARFVTIHGKRIPIRPYRRNVGQYAWLHHEEHSSDKAEEAEKDVRTLLTQGLRDAADGFERAFGGEKMDHKKAKAALKELHELVREAESALDSGWFERGGEYTRTGKMVMRKPKPKPEENA
jgi:rubrerythrin